MDCREYINSYLSADADRELSPQEAREASQHLVICRGCAERLASERAFKSFVRRRIQIVSTPAGIRQRIAGEVDRSGQSGLGGRIRTLRPAVRWAPVAIAAVLLVIILFARSSQKAEVPAFDQAVDSYSAMQNNFVPTVSAESGTKLGDHYNDWISHELGMPLKAWNFDKLGYHFVGGRADQLPDGRRVVYTVYSGPEGKIVCAFERAVNFPIPPGGETVNRVHHFYRYKGMSLCLTVMPNMVCILTCRMPLDDFIHAIKQVES
ncbi:MAG TPA: zf-HC2 domain-containing protein [Candidatus Binataceae bacterium]|nr:zf-HC2 domain-containing protein [Candidatus Binataceae bacterium]